MIFFQNVASCERAKKIPLERTIPLFSPLLLGAAQRIETACYIGTIVDSMTWRQAKYPAPGRSFGRPGGNAGMRPRRGLLKLLLPTDQSKS